MSLARLAANHSAAEQISTVSKVMCTTWKIKQTWLLCIAPEVFVIHCIKEFTVFYLGKIVVIVLFRHFRMFIIRVMM